jgi:hypothetical protein
MTTRVCYDVFELRKPIKMQKIQEVVKVHICRRKITRKIIVDMLKRLPPSSPRSLDVSRAE